MSFLFNLVKSAFLGMLRLFWFDKQKMSNSLSIYIKTNTGNTLSVELDPKWDIKNLKEIVAPRMGIEPENIKIIFAGKELHDSIIIEVRACLYTHAYKNVFLLAYLITIFIYI